MDYGLISRCQRFMNVNLGPFGPGVGVQVGGFGGGGAVFQFVELFSLPDLKRLGVALGLITVEWWGCGMWVSRFTQCPVE